MATVLLLGTETPLLEGLAQTLAAHGHAAWAIHEPTDLLAAARAAGPVLLLVERTLLLEPDIARLLPLAIGHTTIITFREGLTTASLAERGPALSPLIQRLVLADLCLPLENLRLAALVGSMERRAALVAACRAEPAALRAATPPATH